MSDTYDAAICIRVCFVEDSLDALWVEIWSVCVQKSFENWNDLVQFFIKSVGVKVKCWSGNINIITVSKNTSFDTETTRNQVLIDDLKNSCSRT